jgi:hypothetical protein
MTANPALRTLRELRRILREAVDQAKLGHAFSPNSYSYRAMSACLAAEVALDALSDSLSISEQGP